MRKKESFPLTHTIKSNLLHWGNSFECCAYFNPNNTVNYPFSPFLHFLAVANKNTLPFKGIDDFSLLKEFLATNNRWLVGHLSYDLKNQVEKLESSHSSAIDFPLGNFFIPEHLIFLDGDQLTIESEEPLEIYEQIKNFTFTQVKSQFKSIKLKTTKEEYQSQASRLIDHIYEGDIYEINYCIEHLVNELQLDPVLFYEELCKSSPTPFSTFYKLGDKYALGASPERFLKKSGDQLISQPIKGTAKRGISDSDDQEIIDNLRNNEKERAENMMIVDLVRNDLAKSAVTGSVKVEEIFGIYTFKHWHQMISTVSAKIRPDITAAEVLKNAFPMGSMTGAPKVKVMELIERYENFKRGLYSGAIGYFTPEGDFDFNVVIRTLFYDKAKHLGSFMVGSAITSDASPEQEFEECKLKAKPIVETLLKA